MRTTWVHSSGRFLRSTSNTHQTSTVSSWSTDSDSFRSGRDIHIILLIDFMCINFSFDSLFQIYIKYQKVQHFEVIHVNLLVLFSPKPGGIWWILTFQILDNITFTIRHWTFTKKILNTVYMSRKHKNFKTQVSQSD